MRTEESICDSDSSLDSSFSQDLDETTLSIENTTSSNHNNNNRVVTMPEGDVPVNLSNETKLVDKSINMLDNSLSSSDDEENSSDDGSHVVSENFHDLPNDQLQQQEQPQQQNHCASLTDDPKSTNRSAEDTHRHRPKNPKSKEHVEDLPTTIQEDLQIDKVPQNPYARPKTPAFVQPAVAAIQTKSHVLQSQVLSKASKIEHYQDGIDEAHLSDSDSDTSSSCSSTKPMEQKTVTQPQHRSIDKHCPQSVYGSSSDDHCDSSCSTIPNRFSSQQAPSSKISCKDQHHQPESQCDKGPRSVEKRERMQTSKSQESIQASNRQPQPTSPTDQRLSPQPHQQSCRPLSTLNFQAATLQPIQWSQQLESDLFRSKLAHKFVAFERRNPQIQLRDYEALDPSGQRVEQERVVALLDRLGIRGRDGEELTSSTQRKNLHHEYNSNAHKDESMLSPRSDSIMLREQSMTRLDDTNLDDTNLDQMRVDDSRSASPQQPQHDIREQKYIHRIVHHQANQHSQQHKISQKANHDIDAKQQQNNLTLQLSPILKTSPDSQSPNMHVRFTADSSASIVRGTSPISFQAGGNDNDCDDYDADTRASDRSVEVTRGTAEYMSDSSGFQSPPLQQTNRSLASKRNASASGKRGSDMCRTRLNTDCRYPDTPHDSSDEEIMPSLSQQWHDSPNDSVSLVSAGEEHPCYPFSASQSPIDGEIRRRHSSPNSGSQQAACHDEYSSKGQYRSSYRPSGRPSQRQYNESRYYNDESIQSVNASRRERPGRDRLREISSNVALKDGVPLHFNPLHIKRSKRITARERRDNESATRNRNEHAEFRDPLKSFHGQESENLHCVFDWIVARDNAVFAKWSLDSKGIVFSLNQAQIRSVVIKVLMEADVLSTRGANRYGDESSLSGQTLIIVRGKEDITVWQRALRELTPFSVIDHAGLPASERKRSTTAAKCATFDIVISTYDSIKSSDITVQLDEFGHAMPRESVESQGWMTKRSSQYSQRIVMTQQLSPPVQCRPLSVLHHVKWRRVMFVDELGRKCYLAKYGTARASAARAINSDSRFIFFSKTDNDKEAELSAFEELTRSHPRSMQSIADSLRIELEEDNEDLLDVVIDPAQGL